MNTLFSTIKHFTNILHIHKHETKQKRIMKTKKKAATTTTTCTKKKKKKKKEEEEAAAAVS